jgi:hypothetical protein
MFVSWRLNKRIPVDEGFDADDPMAGAIRSLVPPDSQMDLQSRDQMMGHLYSVREGSREGGVDMPPRSA